MLVSVDLGRLGNGTAFDRETNSIEVDQTWLLRNDSGYNHIKVNASYVEPANGQLVSFAKTIYLVVIDPEPVSPDPPVPVIPVNSEVGEGEVQKLPFEVVTLAEAQRMANSSGPVPYVKSFSWNGELLIGWTRDLVVLQNATGLPQERIAIQKEAYVTFKDGESGTAVRRLQTEVVLTDDIKYLIANALEISSADPEDNSKLSWSVKQYLEDELILKLQFEPGFSSDELILTFWGTKYFRDQEG